VSRWRGAGAVDPPPRPHRGRVSAHVEVLVGTWSVLARSLIELLASGLGRFVDVRATCARRPVTGHARLTGHEAKEC